MRQRSNFDGTLLVISAIVACSFVSVAIFATGRNETLDRIVEDAHHFLTHFFPAMLAGYGLGKVGEVGVKKLRKKK